MTAGEDPTRSTRIDFAALRARLDEAVAGRAADPRLVLETRARALARPAAPAAGATSNGNGVELLVLRRAGAVFGVDVAHVLDVSRVASLTVLPGADAPVVGVLPWRGRLLTVVDLARSEEAIARVVVLQGAGGAVGVAADLVEDVRAVDPAAIHATAPTAGDSFVRAITSDAISLLDPDALVRRLTSTR